MSLSSTANMTLGENKTNKNKQTNQTSKQLTQHAGQREEKRQRRLGRGTTGSESVKEEANWG